MSSPRKESKRAPSREPTQIVKILLLGTHASGKSSLLLRYCEEPFNPDFMVTIGVDFRKQDFVIDGTKICLHVYDTAGSEKFASITRAYYRGAHGVLLVC